MLQNCLLEFKRNQFYDTQSDSFKSVVLLKKIVKRRKQSTTETASKMNDIRIELPKTEAELRKERESLLDGMFGASEHAAAAELARQARYPRRDIVFSGKSRQKGFLK